MEELSLLDRARQNESESQEEQVQDLSQTQTQSQSQMLTQRTNPSERGEMTLYQEDSLDLPGEDLSLMSSQLMGTEFGKIPAILWYLIPLKEEMPR